MTVFIQKGDKPLSVRQAVKRGLRYFENEKRYFEREQGIVEESAEYKAWANQWIQDNLVNAEHNTFNHQLSSYKKALARLSQYKLSEGREAVTEIQEVINPETGEITEEEFIVLSAIDPLEPEVEIETYDELTGEPLGPTLVPNPLIVQDEQERSEAQTVLDNTPSEIIAFYNQ